LKEKGDMVTCKQEANILSDNYEDVSNIPVNMKHQKRSKRETMKEEDSDNDCWEQVRTKNKNDMRMEQYCIQRSYIRRYAKYAR